MLHRRDRCHFAIQRINPKVKISRNRAQQRGISALTVTTRHTGQRNCEITLQIAIGRLPENMQPVPDLRFFQLAQIGIKLGQIVVFVTRHARINSQSRHLGERQYLAAKVSNPTRINTRGLVVFIHKCFEVSQRPIAFGACQRWRQMVNNHSRSASLRLCAFTRIIDDEWIDMRGRAQNHLGPAGFRERNRLAGQPFKIAVLAHMHDRIGAPVMPEPEIERQIVMRRHKIG